MTAIENASKLSRAYKNELRQRYSFARPRKTLNLISVLPEALEFDSRLKSGTGVLFFRLFLLPCPNSATSVILRRRGEEDDDDLT